MAAEEVPTEALAKELEEQLKVGEEPPVPDLEYKVSGPQDLIRVASWRRRCPEPWSECNLSGGET
jgi:hypothetical protein